MQYATARKYEGVRGVDDTAAPAGSERTAPATPAFIESEIDRLVEAYADLITRVSYTYLGSRADAEDICQTVFLKLFDLMGSGTRRFTSAEHEKAWIIRATIIACKDVLKSAYRQRATALDDEAGVQETAVLETLTTEGPEAEIAGSDSPVLAAVNALPALYRETIYLYYYEGYSAREISTITGASEVAVNARLSRGRKTLREMLKGDAR